MEREEFLKKLGIGTLAACMGCSMVSCSKKGDAGPAGDGSPAPGSGTVLTADLGSSLTNIGDSKTAGGVIVVRIATGNTTSSFTAVQVACTHEGTAINYNQSAGFFICPLHDSHFSKTGAVLQGPATISLKSYTVNITGTTLTVVA